MDLHASIGARLIHPDFDVILHKKEWFFIEGNIFFMVNIMKASPSPKFQ